MDYINQVIQSVKDKNPNEHEYIQAVSEVLLSLAPAIQKDQDLYKKNGILERLVEPDRCISFRVCWVDDSGKPQINRGYRVQFNNAIGPYKGGLRFHPSVNLSVIKFLAFEQTFKNSLTTLPMGGGKGGADFDPRGKSDGEIMRFCQAFMTELYRHIGPDIDVPAGDIGVSQREVGYMFGQYKRIRGAYENGVLTGKHLSFGGSLIRPEATGYGAVYFLEQVLNHFNQNIKGLTFALSGFGNVAWGSAKKIIELGGKVVTLSGQDGYIYFENGLSAEGAENIILARKQGLTKQEFADKFGGVFYKNQQPWGKVKADVYMPCATQNEIDLEQAIKAVQLGVKFVNEGANMPTTNQAIDYFKDHGVIVCPAKAANAGGVAVSGLEMSQNSQRLSWTKEEVDNKLKVIMRGIYNQLIDAANEFGIGYDLCKAANLAGFKKVAAAMIMQGIY